MKRDVLILICGNARAGKDTFAGGIEKACDEIGANQGQAIAVLPFAKCLKDAGDGFLKYLGLNETFYDEDFKVRNRDFLVVAGTMARSVDPDVFAKAFVETVRQWTLCSNADRFVIVCPDWRYHNESAVVQANLPDWDVVRVYVETSGVGPANEEEGKSIGQIRRHCPFDHEFYFAPKRPDQVRDSGYELGMRYLLKQ